MKTVNEISPRNTRRESRNLAGRFRGGKLAPVMIVPFLPGESGMLSQRGTIQLDPIAGRLLTPITAEFISVFVPLEAAREALSGTPNSNTAVTEILRREILNGPLFSVGSETDVTKRLGVVPISVGGAKRVSTLVGLSHAAAVNFLRKRAYPYATQVTGALNTVSPAIFSESVLQRFNAVLDPDDHVNGAVSLNIPSMRLPIDGLGIRGDTTSSAATYANVPHRQTPGAAPVDPVNYARSADGSWSETSMRVVGTTIATSRPDVYAIFDGAAAGGVSLTDFYNAEKQDALTRLFDEVRTEKSHAGEEAIWRFVNGLKLDESRYPFVLHESSRIFGDSYTKAQDGAGMESEISMTDSAVNFNFTVPVPTTELGGCVITFMTVKPDETILRQPHPILTRTWSLTNVAKESMILEPQQVLMRDVYADVASASETTPAFYAAHNELLKNYTNYGFTDATDLSTVEAKNAIWQIAVPASVTPDSVIYPETVPHYPFLDQTAEVAFYTISSEAVISTPKPFGPTPVETIAVIDSKNIFG